MNKKYRSAIWKLSKNELESLIQNSQTMSDVLSFFGLRNKGSNYQTLVRRLKYEKIDYSKFKSNQSVGRIRPIVSLEEVLTENSNYSRATLKKRLIKEGLLENKCVKCGLGPEWEKQKLVMVLDHVNGIHNDNRIENLRLLCPNCNSQTTTFAGKNNRREIYEKNCKGCGIEIKGKRKDKKYCRQCEEKQVFRTSPRLCFRKVERPSKEELKKMLWEIPTTKLAEQYGVSDQAIGKWAKTYGLEKPPRGYWAQKGKTNLNRREPTI
jgi:Zn finger protein HypA/HybF involved in hydrogenase expression